MGTTNGMTLGRGPWGLVACEYSLVACEYSQAAASARGPVPVQMWQGEISPGAECCGIHGAGFCKAWQSTRLVLLELDEQLRLHLLVPRRIERPLHKPNGLPRQQPVTCHQAPCTMPMQPTCDTGASRSESPPSPQTRVAATRRNACELCRPLFGTPPTFSGHSPARPSNKVDLPSGSHVLPAESRSV